MSLIIIQLHQDDLGDEKGSNWHEFTFYKQEETKKYHDEDELKMKMLDKIEMTRRGK